MKVFTERIEEKDGKINVFQRADEYKVSECCGEEEKLNKVLKSIRDISSSISN